MILVSLPIEFNISLYLNSNYQTYFPKNALSVDSVNWETLSNDKQDDIYEWITVCLVKNVWK